MFTNTHGPAKSSGKAQTLFMTQAVSVVSMNSLALDVIFVCRGFEIASPRSIDFSIDFVSTTVRPSAVWSSMD
jgi:hypothetical protein